MDGIGSTFTVTVPPVVLPPRPAVSSTVLHAVTSALAATWTPLPVTLRRVWLADMVAAWCTARPAEASHMLLCAAATALTPAGTHWEVDWPTLLAAHPALPAAMGSVCMAALTDPTGAAGGNPFLPLYHALRDEDGHAALLLRLLRTASRDQLPALAAATVLSHPAGFVAAVRQLSSAPVSADVSVAAVLQQVAALRVIVTSPALTPSWTALRLVGGAGGLLAQVVAACHVQTPHAASAPGPASVTTTLATAGGPAGTGAVAALHREAQALAAVMGEARVQ